MGNDDCPQRVKKRDIELMKDLPCAKYGMKFHQVFEILVSFCKENPRDFERWYNERCQKQKSKKLK